jgi:hypothetical protein
MKTQTPFFKKPIVHAVLIGAFGGMAPKLIELVPALFADQLPSAGMLLGFMLLALFGSIIIIVYHEENLQKALILGAGAPALISALIAQAAGPKSDSASIFPMFPSIVSTAYAQEPPKMDTIRLVVQSNKSSFKLNTLWIRADEIELKEYKVHGDTVIVPYPSAAKELRINLPSQGNSLSLPVSELPQSKLQHIKILNDQQAKDFWQTFGGKSVPKYRIEKAE